MKLNNNKKSVKNFSQPVHAVRRHGVRHCFCFARVRRR